MTSFLDSCSATSAISFESRPSHSRTDPGRIVRRGRGAWTTKDITSTESRNGKEKRKGGTRRTGKDEGVRSGGVYNPGRELPWRSEERNKCEERRRALSVSHRPELISRSDRASPALHFAVTARACHSHAPPGPTRLSHALVWTRVGRELSRVCALWLLHALYAIPSPSATRFYNTTPSLSVTAVVIVLLLSNTCLRRSILHKHALGSVWS